MVLLLFCGVYDTSPDQLFRMTSEKAGGSHAGETGSLTPEASGDAVRRPRIPQQRYTGGFNS